MKTLVTVLTMLAVIAAGAAWAAETPAPTKPASPPAAKKAETTAKKTDPAASAKPAPAQLGMSVSGTQESPKVLYIVPWKTIDAVPAEPYVSGLLDEVFAPVDPVEFERSVHQHQQLQTPAAAQQQ